MIWQPGIFKISANPVGCQAFEQEHGNLGETWGALRGPVPNDLEKPIAAAPDTMEWCQKVIDIAPVYMSV